MFIQVYNETNRSGLFFKRSEMQIVFVYISVIEYFIVYVAIAHNVYGADCVTIPDLHKQPVVLQFLHRSWHFETIKMKLFFILCFTG